MSLRPSILARARGVPRLATFRRSICPILWMPVVVVPTHTALSEVICKAVQSDAAFDNLFVIAEDGCGNHLKEPSNGCWRDLACRAQKNRTAGGTPTLLDRASIWGWALASLVLW